VKQLSSDQTEAVIAMALEFARQGETAQLMELVAHGLPIDVVDTEGNTPLMLAAYRGQLDTVKALLARGADVDLCNARGQSPLAGAIFKGEDEIAKALLAAGADPDAGTPSARATAELFGRSALME